MHKHNPVPSTTHEPVYMATFKENATELSPFRQLIVRLAALARLKPHTYKQYPREERAPAFTR